MPEGRTIQFTNSSGTFSLGDVETAASDFAAGVAAAALEDAKEYTDTSVNALRAEANAKSVLDEEARSQLRDAIAQGEEDAKAYTDAALVTAKTYTDTVKVSLEGTFDNLEDTLLAALQGHDTTHTGNHEDQALAIALLDQEQSDDRARIIALESDKAEKSALEALGTSYAQLREDYTQLSQANSKVGRWIQCIRATWAFDAAHELCDAPFPRPTLLLSLLSIIPIRPAGDATCCAAAHGAP